MRHQGVTVLVCVYKKKYTFAHITAQAKGDHIVDAQTRPRDTYACMRKRMSVCVAYADNLESQQKAISSFLHKRARVIHMPHLCLYMCYINVTHTHKHTHAHT